MTEIASEMETPHQHHSTALAGSSVTFSQLCKWSWVVNKIILVQQRSSVVWCLLPYSARLALA